ncbi:MAG: hypothetical protein R2729_13930 [Bryobacteraceae bacterium]
MLLLLALSIPAAGWIPARWHSADLKTLETIKLTPVNCLLLEREHWSAEFSAAAAEKGIVTLGVIPPGGKAGDLAGDATKAKLSGVVFEGFPSEPPAKAYRDAGLTVVEMGPRTRMQFEGAEIAATNQGVWAGINPVEDGSAKAAPSGGPWIDTNGGFLRFARAAASATIWMGNQPPKDAAIPVARYLQAVADAAILSARWVIALDPEFEGRLLRGEAKALDDWKAIGAHLAFYESHQEWRAYEPVAQLILVQDVDSGGLFSGGVLDMISVKHTPVRAVPAAKLTGDEAMRGATMAVNVDPAATTPQQKEILRRFTRAGGTLLTAPPGWKFPAQRDDQITLDKDDVHTIDQIWREINNMTGRRNLGARLFNVSTMLSSLSAPESGKPLVLQMVNYSDYPVEDVTVHVLGKFGKATLLAPGGPPRAMEVYDNEEGTGIDIDKITTVAALVLE